MKKVLLFLMTMLLAACSAPMPGEELGSTQEAVGTCPRPYGGWGDTTAPISGYVSAIKVHPTQPWKLGITANFQSRYVDFGGVDVVNAQAKITGPGWTSTGGKTVDEVMFLNATDGYAQTIGCANDPNLVCMIVSESGSSGYIPILYFDKGYAYPGNEHFSLGVGLTAVVGMGTTLPQKLRFWGDFAGGGVGYRNFLFSGPKLDACAYP